MNRIDSLREAVFQRMSELMQEIETLQKENQRLREGFQGACYACEPVAELNQKLAEAGHALYHALGYFTDSFEFMMIRDSYSEEKKAVETWKELFDNNIPKPSYYED